MAKTMTNANKSELNKLLFQAKERRVKALQERLQMVNREKSRRGEALQAWLREHLLKVVRASIKADGIVLEGAVEMEDFQWSRRSEPRVVSGVPKTIWDPYIQSKELSAALGKEISDTQRLHDTLRAEIEVSEVVDQDLHAQVLNFIKEVK